jgi:iron complex transport system ATP-binding protein
VLSGTFAAAFARDGLAFDPATGTFQLHEGQGPAVRVVGEGAGAFWTRRALEREGYNLTTSPAAPTQILVGGAPGEWRWTSQVQGKQQIYTTVQELLAGLRTPHHSQPTA